MFVFLSAYYVMLMVLTMLIADTMTRKRQKKKQVMMMSMVSLVGVTTVHTAVDTGCVVHST